MSEQLDQVWLVTGASSGFGKAICREAVARGHRVVATARDRATLADILDGAADGQLLTLDLDVTDQHSIDAAVEKALTGMGRVDVLVNNAGRGHLGAWEELSEKEIRDLYDVNVIGLLMTTKAVLPHLRQRGSGTVVNITSVGGIRANPGHGLYGSSKFAVEGASEALALEMAPFGVRVLLVEPGPFRTDFGGRSMGLADQIEAYDGTPARQTRERLQSSDQKQPNDPARAATLIADAVADPDAPLRLPLGPEAIEAIRTKLTDQLGDLDRVADVVADTGFPPG